jgi:hypothetical protein
MLLPNKRTAARLLLGLSWPIAVRQLLGTEQRERTFRHGLKRSLSRLL